jgi:uncharacterized protein (TIRG00374 family)
LRTGKAILIYAVSFLLCAGVLFYLLREISLKDIWQLIVNADKGALLIFLCFSLSMSIFRAWRYKILLNFSGHKPHPFSLFLVVLIRNFCSDLLPARTGSLIYIFLLNKRLNVSLDQASSSFSLAFVFDICSVAPLVVIATLFLGDSSAGSGNALITAALIFLFLSVLLIYLTPVFFHLAAVFIKKTGFIPSILRERLSEFLNKVNADIRQIKEAGFYLKIFIISIIIRALKYAGLYFMLYALLAPLGYTYSMLPWAKVFFGLIVPEFAASLPISGIGGFGAYQGAWVFMFDLLKFPLEMAKLTSLSHHLLTQIYGLATALIGFFLLLLPFPKVRQAQ